MSGPTVNRWTRAWKLFWKQRSLMGKDSVKFIGKDHLGNKYFEAIKPNNSRPIQRYFERPGVQSFSAIVDATHVPPSWDAWLRFRRQDPPSDEEIQDSEEYYRMQQEMAAKRKTQEQGEEKEGNKKNSLSKPKRQPVGSTFTGQ